MDERLIKGVSRIENLFHVIPYDLEKYLKALKILEDEEEVTEILKSGNDPIGYVIQRGEQKIKVFKDKIIC